MNSESLHWSLFHDATKVQIDGLTFTQLKGMLASVEPAQLKLWFAWHEGLSDWKSVTEFPEIVGSQSPMRPLPPFPPRAPTSNPASTQDSEKSNHAVFEMRDEATRVNVMLDKQGFVDHRWNRRFLKNYRVQVTARGKVLDTNVVDISMGGMLLKDDLPLEVSETFEATLTHPSAAKLRITCIKIPPRPGGSWNRVKFTLTPESDNILRTWLLGSDT